MKTNQFSDEQPITNPRLLAAVDELQELVRSHYPEATFSVSRGTFIGGCPKCGAYFDIGAQIVAGKVKRVFFLPQQNREKSE